MLAGASFRRLAYSRFAAAVLGAVLAAGAVLWISRPWADRGPAGRVVLAEPVERYDPRYVYKLPTPAPADWRRTGEMVDCPTIEPKSRAARRDLELFGDDPLGHLLYLDPDVGELPYGGSIRVRRPEADPDAEGLPLVEVDLRASRPPLARWDELHRFELSGGVATLLSGMESWGPGPVFRLGYRPGEGHVRRRWSLAPDFEARYRLDTGTLEASALLTAAYCSGSHCR